MFSVSSVSVGGISCGDWSAAADELGKQLFGALDRVAGQLAIDLNMTLQAVNRTMEARHGGAWPLSGDLFGTLPDRLASRTGGGLKSIARSISVVAASQGDNLVAGKISAADLSIHETGATVTAKSAKYLAIPLRDALDSRGVPLKKGPREWTNTFIKESKRGNLIIFMRQGRKIVPLYLLKRSVTIRPRLGLAEALDAQLSYFENRALLAMEREFGS